MSEFNVVSHPAARADALLKAVRFQTPAGEWSEPDRNQIVIEPAQASQLDGRISVDWGGLAIEEESRVCITLRDTVAKHFESIAMLGHQDLASQFVVDLAGRGISTLNGLEVGVHLLREYGVNRPTVTGARIVRFAVDPAGASIPIVWRTDEQWREAEYPERTGWAFDGDLEADVASLSNAGFICVHKRFEHLLTSICPEDQPRRKQLQCAIGVDVWADVILRAAERLNDEADDAPILTPLREAVTASGITAQKLKDGDAGAHSKLRAYLQSCYLEDKA